MNMSKMLKNLLINNLIFKFLTIIFFISYSFQIVAKNLEIKGLSRMSLDDIQSLTEVDIYSDSLNDSDISILIDKKSSNSTSILSFPFTVMFVC